jgi:tight adherence protein C
MRQFQYFIGLLTGFPCLCAGSGEESLLYSRIRATSTKNKNTLRMVYYALTDFIKPFTAFSLKTNNYKDRVRKLLMSADLASGENNVLDFENKRILVLIGAFILALILFVLKPSYLMLCFCIFLVLVAYKAPEQFLLFKIRKKRRDFNRYFSDAIDLLAVCLEAGLGIGAAIERVGEEFKIFSPSISQEFTRVSKDMASGIPKKEAFEGLVERVQSEDLQSFVAFLIQSERLGISIAQNLYTFCDTLRNKRSQRIETLIQSTSIKMVIPMVFLLLPALFLVIIYPAIAGILRSMPK